MAHEDTNAAQAGTPDEQQNTEGARVAPPTGNGVSSGLQPGGTLAGGGPGVGVGSIGTGGGSTTGAGTGNAAP